MRKVLLLLIVPFILFNAVFVASSGCRAPKRTVCISYSQIVVSAWNNEDSTPQMAGNDGVLANAFYLEMGVGAEQQFCGQFSANPFAGSAYAYYPVVDSARSERWDSVSITSNHNFDAAHPAGVLLNDVFSAAVTKANDHRYYLMKMPADTGTHTFTVTVFIKNPDKTLFASSNPVKLLL